MCVIRTVIQSKSNISRIGIETRTTTTTLNLERDQTQMHFKSRKLQTSAKAIYQAFDSPLSNRSYSGFTVFLVAFMIISFSYSSYMSLERNKKKEKRAATNGNRRRSVMAAFADISYEALSALLFVRAQRTCHIIIIL